MKFSNYYHQSDYEGEINNKPSMTIPNQTLSIPELIRRYASGQSLEGSKTPIYDDEPTEDILRGRPFASYDLSEQHQIIRQAKQYYDETINRLRNNQQTEQKSTDKVDLSSEDKPTE